jgi:hypothetical protein
MVLSPVLSSGSAFFRRPPAQLSPDFFSPELTPPGSHGRGIGGLPLVYRHARAPSRLVAVAHGNRKYCHEVTCGE